MARTAQTLSLDRSAGQGIHAVVCACQLGGYILAKAWLSMARCGAQHDDSPEWRATLSHGVLLQNMNLEG
eukprot:29815-Chlamydomonas_euryale.AAC.2